MQKKDEKQQQIDQKKKKIQNDHREAKKKKRNKTTSKRVKTSTSRSNLAATNTDKKHGLIHCCPCSASLFNYLHQQEETVC